MAADSPILELEDIWGGYLADAPVLRGISIAVPANTITSIIGANGAGKSTLLKAAFGVLPERKGRLLLDGREMVRWNAQEALKNGVAYVAQGRCNFPAMTVRENLEMGCFTRRDAGVRSDIAAVMARFPVLKEKERQLAGNLSGGQQQVLEMAMALVNRPRLLLLDEPTLGLSPKMFDEVFAAIHRLKDDGMSILMVEQNAARSLEISDYAFVLDLGRKKMEGPAHEILYDPAVREQYLGGRRSAKLN